jgi:hypothetical protein
VGCEALNKTYSDFYFLLEDSFNTMDTDIHQKAAVDLNVKCGRDFNASEISDHSLGVKLTSYGSA